MAELKSTGGLPDVEKLKARHISEIGKMVSGLDVLGLYEVARLIRDYIKKREGQ